MARIDLTALERMKKLDLSASLLEGKRIGLPELTRRMSNARSFAALEREILEDAKLKKEFRLK